MRPLVLTVLLAILPVTASAAPPPGAKRPGPHALDPEKREKLMERIDAVRVGKLTEELELDSALAEKVFPVLRPFQQRRREALEKRMTSMRAVKQQLDAETPDEKVIAGELDALAAATKQLNDVAEEEYAALKPVLDPVRLAKYYRFQLQFEARLGELIREVKGGKAREILRERLRDAPE